MEFNNIETIKRAVEIGTGVTILPSVTVKSEIKHRLLKGIPFSNKSVEWPIGIITRNDNTLSPQAQRFVEELMNVYQPKKC